MTDEPLEICATPFGAQIINLADVCIRFGLPKSKFADRCKHRSIIYNKDDRRVWCSDCERTIDNFDAFMIFTEYFQAMESAAKWKNDKAQEALNATINRRATKVIDRAWSAGNAMAIRCPHCSSGLLPEDFANGVAQCSREIELARRERKREQS